MSFVSFSIQNKLKRINGFSLMELMITAGIIMLVTSAVLVKQTGFTHTTLLKSQALEVSLDLRAAQQYGVSPRADATAAERRSGYGMYFDATVPGQYILFLDSDDNKLYDSGEEVGDAYTLDPRFEIFEICHENASGRHCSGNRKASVVFQRPNFDAVVRSSWSDGTNYGVSNREWIEFVVAPIDNTALTRSVIVYQAGQIMVQ